MTAPLALQVPAPAAGYKAIGGGFAPLEQAMTVTFAAVLFPDGSAMTSDDYVGAQALLSRVATPGGLPEIWDPHVKLWKPEAGVELDHLEGLPVAPSSTAAGVWQAILVGSIEQDATGAPQVRPAVSGFPQYRLRGVFHARRGSTGAFGVGPEGPSLQFASVALNSRLGVQLTPDADGATQVQILLRDASATPLGVLDIDASGGGPVITISNRGAAGTLASVRLQSDGSISLLPSPGKRVIVGGDLEAEHVRYLPVGTSAKADL